jgi:hypothetical protein
VDALVGGYRLAFLVAAAFVLVGTVLTLVALRDAGAQASTSLSRRTDRTASREG